MKNFALNNETIKQDVQKQRRVKGFPDWGTRGKFTVAGVEGQVVRENIVQVAVYHATFPPSQTIPK